MKTLIHWVNHKEYTILRVSKHEVEHAQNCIISARIYRDAVELSGLYDRVCPFLENDLNPADQS